MHAVRRRAVLSTKQLSKKIRKRKGRDFLPLPFYYEIAPINGSMRLRIMIHAMPKYMMINTLKSEDPGGQSQEYDRSNCLLTRYSHRYWKDADI